MILDNDTELKRVVELGSEKTWFSYSFSGSCHYNEQVIGNIGVILAWQGGK